MMNSKKLGGAVVPLVTPATAGGEVDLAAFEGLLESQIAAGIEGVLVLGTTGEGPCVPRAQRLPLIQRAVAVARKRILIYANVVENSLTDGVASMNEYFAAGADVAVTLSPYYYPAQPQELKAWFEALLNAASGPVVMYNIPSTTRVSIPLDVVASLLGHPRLAGIKDSENTPARHEELLKRFGGRADFSIFIGVGALMAQGLKSGADGIVPSVGNLIPEVCQEQIDAARRKDWAAVDLSGARQLEVASLYQKGRTLGQSLAAIKGLLCHRGVCMPHVFPPLLPVSPAELAELREGMVSLKLA